MTETRKKALGKGLEQLFSNEVINFDNFENKVKSKNENRNKTEFRMKLHFAVRILSIESR